MKSKKRCDIILCGYDYFRIIIALKEIRFCRLICLIIITEDGQKMKTIMDHLEKTMHSFPDNIAVSDEEYAYSYSELVRRSKSVGTAVAALKFRRRAVAVYMNKTPGCAAAMLGSAYSGNFYVVIDPKMPVERIKKTFSVVEPVAVITEEELAVNVPETGFQGSTFLYSEISEKAADEELLGSIRADMIDTDPLYCLFTSGSTGVPKGTVVSHANVISYTDWFIGAFGIDETFVFGSQTPFYFSMSVTDLYSSLRTGAHLAIIPKKYFSFPIKLIQYLNDKKVNAIYWVPSALCIVANLQLFKYAKPEYLKMVLFAGEVMPTKQLNYWISNFPELKYANLFGPTETTDICTYYVVNRHFEDGDSLPIGNACENCGVIVVNEDGRQCAPGEEGELYVRGSFVAGGYYNNPEKTAEAFVRNPLNTAYPEIVYKTGDIVRYNEFGELIYCGRKDFQIKHMGYRIELGEIENAAMAAEGVSSAACLYDAQKDSIILIYEGKPEKDDMCAEVKSRVPEYMVPSQYIRIKAMPHNSNGKIDRVWLKNNYKEI